MLLSNDRVDKQTFFAGYDINKDREAGTSQQQKGLIGLASFQSSSSPGLNNSIDGIVFNLEVEDTHTFFVGKQKVLVHNK